MTTTLKEKQIGDYVITLRIDKDGEYSVMVLLPMVNGSALLDRSIYYNEKSAKRRYTEMSRKYADRAISDYISDNVYSLAGDTLEELAEDLKEQFEKKDIDRWVKAYGESFLRYYTEE